MPQLLRRIAVLSIASAAGFGLVSPLGVQSTGPAAVERFALLPEPSPSDPDSPADRGTTSTRSSFAIALPAPAAGLSLGERLAVGQIHGPASVVSSPALIPDPTPAPIPPPSAPLPAPAPAPVALAAALPTPAPAPVTAAAPTGPTVTGSASWYCCSAGYGEAATVALPGAYGGQYQPPPATRHVTVCAERCATLPVVDYCGCYWGTAQQRVVDLTPAAWAAVSDASLGAGIIQVTLHLGG